MYVIEDILKTSTHNGKEVVLHISHTYEVWKVRWVIFSFTHFVGGLFIAGIKECKAWEHDQSCQNTGEGIIRDIQYIVVTIAICIRLTYVTVYLLFDLHAWTYSTDQPKVKFFRLQIEFNSLSFRQLKLTSIRFEIVINFWNLKSWRTLEI